MAEKSIKWTQQQREAIEERSRDVLVTASAGTGKTAVLSGRAVDIVADSKICPDLWSILVLTFTDAAAEQMRQRIAEQLAVAYRETKDEHLRRQLALLQGADISTIHSFCKRLITEHFYELGLDPTFGIIDGDEQRLLKTEVLEQTIESAWQQDDLAPGLQELFGGRDIRPQGGFLETVVAISDFLEGVVWPDGWFDSAERLCKQTGSADDIAAAKQKKIIEAEFDEALARLTQVGRIYDRHCEDGSWKEKFAQNYVEPVEKLAKVFAEQGWSDFAVAVKAFDRPRVYSPKDVDADTKEVIREEIKEAFAAVDRVRQLAILNPEYLVKVGSTANRQTLVLIELAKRFEQLYSQAKRALNRLDFADLERYTLELLAQEGSLSDKPRPSAAAIGLRGKYRYVFVDEYQDINPVQKGILDLLAGEGNTFVVGDVKQSIYAFRGAEPAIFIDGLRTASPKLRAKAESRRVDLNWNFRSARGILDFVNLVFGRLMSEEFGGIEYDEAAMLRCASDEMTQHQDSDGPCVELHLLDDRIEQKPLGLSWGSDAEIEEEPSEPGAITARQRQAAMLARRIRQMVGADAGAAEFEIYDKAADARRPVEYRDIVILMRSLAKRANDYVEVLQLAGVPVSCEAAAGYFEATEIRDCLCLLKVLDNPLRDIELAAVLRGPIFKISDTALAKIRLFGGEKRRGYYDCVAAYAKNGDDKQLSAKLQAALGDIESWRTAARAGSIADLLWQIYRRSSLLAFYSALPNGGARKANLLKLHERAIQFEGFAASKGTASLGRFVAFIEELQEAGAEWAGAEPEDTAANAVRIMSVHKSKGLEFPVVFLAELDSRFNLTDLQRDVLLGRDVPIGLKVVDRRANAKLSTAAHQVLRTDKRATDLAEEMRILYVAMTRAKERLVLSASAKRKKCEAILRKGFELGAGAIPSWQLSACQSPLQWLMYGLSNQKLLQESFETGIEADGERMFAVKLYSGDELATLKDYVAECKKVKQPKGARRTKSGKSGLLEMVRKALGWRYQFEAAAVLPAKQSVTQLTHYNDEFVKIDYSRSLQRRPGVVLSEETKRDFAVQGRVVGTAAHLIISRIDLSRQVNAAAIRQVADELVGNGLVTTEAMQHVDIESVADFFKSELGRAALDSKNTVMREWPFTFSLPGKEVDEKAPAADSIVVQGIVDMLIETAEGLVLVDFKTDRVSAGEIEERAEHYTGQVRLYARAAEVILAKTVRSKWLYFLSAGRAVNIA